MNKKNTFLAIFAIVILLISGCNQTKKQATSNCDAIKEKTKFFSLKNYFCETITEFDSLNYKVNKRVSFGDNSEFKEGLEVNWKTEFETFIASDINNSAWFDKFKTDTNTLADSYIVTYTTNAASIPVKKLQVQFLNDKTLSKIKIETERNNILYKSKQLITFEAGKHYHVDGFQRTLFLSKSEFEVDGVIVQSENQ